MTVLAYAIKIMVTYPLRKYIDAKYQKNDKKDNYMIMGSHLLNLKVYKSKEFLKLGNTIL